MSLSKKTGAALPPVEKSVRVVSPSNPLPAQHESVSIDDRTAACIDAVRKALEAVRTLARERSDQKLSNSRVLAVAHELGEVLKVLSRYCTQETINRI